MTPQARGSAAETLTQEEEHQMQRMMAKRLRIIKELIQTENDYLNDLELCIREVVQPLRNKQVNATLRVLPTPILSRITSTMKWDPQVYQWSITAVSGKGWAFFPEPLGLVWQKALSYSCFLCQKKDTWSLSIWPRKLHLKILGKGCSQCLPFWNVYIFFLGFLWNE